MLDSPARAPVDLLTDKRYKIHNKETKIQNADQAGQQGVLATRYKRHNREFTKYTTVPALLTEQRLQSLNELQLRGFVEHVMARNCRPAISGNQLCDTLPGNA